MEQNEFRDVITDSLTSIPRRRVTAAGQDQVVDVNNFIRAETDTYFVKKAAVAGGVGQFNHNRTPVAIDKQTVVRMNRDTLYSNAVFDLTAPLTITVPDSGDRFMSMVVINEDHYIKFVTYDPGVYTFTAEEMGARYVQIVFRTFVNPVDAEDIKIATGLQDQIGVSQESVGVLDLPTWDQESLDGCRAAILCMGPFVPDSTGMFGDEDEVDPVRHLIGTAGGWGGNRAEDAIYLNVMPEGNDGQTPYVLTVKDVPVDGFWSISLYNEEGFFEQNEYEAYAVNNVTAVPKEDGSFTVHFGGDPQSKNFLAIMPGWNYTVRLYQPRAEILDGVWQFPEAAPL